MPPMLGMPPPLANFAPETVLSNFSTSSFADSMNLLT
eukprot:CAMPEP_0176175220 /NCGR_PEP_ID=MMETSP0120_2-20121206/89766_1 /TAXON_ID=160619 /ORGANISM="Kryptoperidinium foliaceum, Strain CCMP 1326" /LENGTH=36 /DNA_ID= /DNA_START= /DNA_END= /DNA_ORIENTATION=